MSTSPDTTGRVREHFRRKAFSFDHLYDEEHALQRLLRPGLFNRRELALEVAHEYDTPSVLDVGGGSGRIGELSSGSAIASFPRWTWAKGPVRKLRYEVINNCPIFDYEREQLRTLFADAGFERITIRQGHSGFLVRADR